MSNPIEVGKIYKLLDASKDPMLTQALALGWVVLPADGIITVHSTEKAFVTGETMGCSHTEGCGGNGNAGGVSGDYLVIQQSGLDNGAFEELA